MTWLDLTLRILAALAAGLALGMERDLRGHPAGLRTHLLVAVGAAVFTIAGAYGFADLERNVGFDPARVAAQVASGIGFIGAGAILRDGASVKGLTTAATLWLAASVGVLAGVGDFVLVAVTTVVVLGALVGLPYLRPSRWRGRRELEIRLRCTREPATLAAVLTRLRSSSIEIGGIDVRDRGPEEDRRIRIQLSAPRRLADGAIIQRLSGLGGVVSVAVRERSD